MFKYLIQSQSGDLNWMAIFALVTFFTIFVMAIWLVLTRDRAFYDHMASLPLDDSEPEKANRNEA